MFQASVRQERRSVCCASGHPSNCRSATRTTRAIPDDRLLMRSIHLFCSLNRIAPHILVLRIR